jgi:hypothetical protein
MSAKHTPGPWRLGDVADDSGRIVKLCPVDQENQSILTVVDHEGVKFAAVYIDADARLIAAAPELLLALEMLLDWHISETPEDEEFSAVRGARAAIAKAKGGAA